MRSRTILCFQKPSIPARRETLTEILQAARARHAEAIVLPNVSSSEEIRSLIASLKPLGCIANRFFVDDAIKGNALRNTPTVFLGHNPHPDSRKSLLIRDNATAIADLALQELLTCAPASYAYLDDASGAEWSQRRGETFARAVAVLGKSCVILNAQTLKRKLSILLRPVGVFAANDATASTLYSIAQQCRLVIPRDLAVIGVDNDELLCESLTPPLSSIQMDLAACGHLAVEWLLQPSRVKILEYGPITVIRRASTSRSPVVGQLVQKALGIIASQACSVGFSVDDIAARLGYSRRYIDRLFQEQQHQTVLEVIHEVRFARILTLLSKKDTPIGAIAEATGFGTQIALQKFFQRRMGISMREWRRQHNIVDFR